MVPHTNDIDEHGDRNQAITAKKTKYGMLRTNEPEHAKPSLYPSHVCHCWKGNVRSANDEGTVPLKRAVTEPQILEPIHALQLRVQDHRKSTKKVGARSIRVL